MTISEIIALFIGSGGLLGLFLLAFRMGRLVQKIDGISVKAEEFKAETAKKFEDMGKRFDKIDTALQDMKTSINAVALQLGKLEIRVEERTLRTVQPYEKATIGG